ncbi:MAG: methylated-DNA--[protein]-cysteine S-methyltransferase [Gemmatimonadetes bacterium]|nr:methylated-DNA--[protein]-cysteine S-methyltransferase [Gemmatimonadota bacterium]MCC6773617.1 methylated-DNA--[protein]-cysteine S-methyltransferase [Gemmatimonadaceae bacterium]
MSNHDTVHFTTMPSPLGELLLTGDGRHLTGLFMSPHAHAPEQQPSWVRDDAAFVDAVRQLNEYFEGRRVTFEIPLAPDGTEFQRRVWMALRDIPFAQTVSYGDIAREIGNPKGVRAVGLANGRNPISIIVPCHRVIGSNGSLTGYGGGLDRKQWLLAHEARTAGLLGTPLGGAA